jgi:hypothetical protein
MRNYAPIVLFVYNRPKHTEATLVNLSLNHLADKSRLYILCDGPKKDATESEIYQINQVRDLVKSKKWCKDVFIKEYDTNRGLADSIIEGVTNIIEEYGKIIVLEDDLIPSRYYLKFMNEALNKYESKTSVMQISGFSYPIDLPNNNASYFIRATTTWGWATWKRVWDKIDFECKDYPILKTDKEMSHRFNLDGAYNYTKMFMMQMESDGKVNSWGIRFWWSIFKMDGLVLYPDNTLILNSGWDGSGNHGDNYELYKFKKWNSDYLINTFPEVIKEDTLKMEMIKKLIKSRTFILTKIVSKIRFYIGKIFN